MSSAALVRDKAQRMLVDELNLNVRLISNGFQVPFESTAVNIVVIEQGEGDASQVLLKMWVPVLRDVRETPELFRWVAVKGTAYVFGHACWNPDEDYPGTGMRSFDHTLLGDYLDLPELHAALGALATTADEVDDSLHHRFGGQRFVDPDQ